MYKAESVYMQKLGDYERLPNNTSGTCGLKNSADFQSSSAFFFSRYLNDDRRWALARSVSGRANLTLKTSQHKNIFESVFSTLFPHVSQHSEYIVSVVKLQQSLIPKKNFKTIQVINLHKIFMDKHWVHGKTDRNELVICHCDTKMLSYSFLSQLTLHAFSVLSVFVIIYRS